MGPQTSNQARHERTQSGSATGRLLLRWQLTDDGLRSWWAVVRETCPCGWSGAPATWTPADFRAAARASACPHCGDLPGQVTPAALAA
jgi:hypothetical protein